MSSQLKTVDDYNREKATERAERERKTSMTGVACPKCGGELHWAERPNGFVSYPPPVTRKSYCHHCTLTIELQLP